MVEYTAGYHYYPTSYCSGVITLPNEEWITVKEAAIMIGVHDRTIRRYIKDHKLESRKDGARVLVSRDSVNALSMIDHRQDQDTEDVDHRQDHIEDHTPDTEVQLLREQIRRQDDEVEFLRDRLKEVEEQRSKEKERADTIILQQTRQLEQTQRLLEDHSLPWYRRMFKSRNKPE